MSKIDQYNTVLKQLFEDVLKPNGFYGHRPPEPREFNRVRRMCKTYSPEIMKDSIEKFSEIFEWQDPPEFATVDEALNYLQGIARKTLLTSTTVGDIIKVEDLFKTI